MADHLLLSSAKDEQILTVLHTFLARIGATLLVPFLLVMTTSSQLRVCVCVCICVSLFVSLCMSVSACVCACALVRAHAPIITFVSLIYHLLYNVQLLNLVVNSNSHHRKLW